MDTWDTAITGDFELFDDELKINTTGYFNDTDGINRVTWADLGISGIIAVNYFWFYTATKEMIESEVRFNSQYTWSVNDSCADDAMDLQNVATHEFGHNGLNDLYMPPSIALTMQGWSYGDGETDKRTLGTGDISGIQALYGGEQISLEKRQIERVKIKRFRWAILFTSLFFGLSFNF